jgi:adenylate cyclase
LVAGWHAFPVIARTSTVTYKGRTGDIKKVGEELGARYIVEGSVRKSGRRVRVTAQLIQAGTGHHIMAERCDRGLSDLFELQDEIVTAIAAANEPELLKFERERIAERLERDEDAYELYQLGLWHHHRQNKADNLEAERLFRPALVINPDYANDHRVGGRSVFRWLCPLGRGCRTHLYRGVRVGGTCSRPR